MIMIILDYMIIVHIPCVVDYFKIQESDFFWMRTIAP